MPAIPRDSPPDVELTVPADSAFVSMLRTASAGLAARLDFTMDDIEDLRIAVGEAFAMVLPEADPGSRIACDFRLGTGELTVTVSVSSLRPAEPDYDSFAWQVLTTLATDARAEAAGGRFSVSLTKESGITTADV